MKFLDGLRGLAAFIVVIDHIAVSFFPAAVDIDAPAHHWRYEWLIERTPLHLLVAGNFSVCIFFVLSGFVLSAKFMATRDRHVVYSMAIKRYFRLALPILASVLLAYVLLRFHAFRNIELSRATGSLWLLRFWREIPSFWQALYHGALGLFISGQSDAYNTVLWTMKVEMLGSFMVFALLLTIGKLRHRWLLYLLLSLLFIKTYYVAFLAGMALSDFYQAGRAVVLKSWLQNGGSWLLIIIGLYLGSSPVDSLRGTPFRLLEPIMPSGLYVSRLTHLVGAMLLVFAILYSSKPQRFLSKKPLVYLGDLSFGLYLTHFFIIGTVASTMFVHLPDSINYGMRFAITILPTLLIIWLVALLFMKFVDKPAMAFANWFYKALPTIFSK